MEEYKTIADYENYEVSNLGNVRNKKTGRVLKPRLNIHGYYTVNLCKEGKAINKTIHRLECNAFLDNSENKPCIDHVNNDKLNNDLKNLRWCSYKENNQNSKIRKNNTSGVKGVYFHKATNKWMAYIMINGITIVLGYFENIEDARDARVAAANKAFGVFTNSCELLKA